MVRGDLLTAADEQLNHQAPFPLRVPATTDHRFYDRHWFEAVDADQGVAALIGLGVYKNMDVADGFLSVQHNGEQHNLRISRPLGPDVSATVGQLDIAVTKPFEQVSITLDDPALPVGCRLFWESSSRATLEDSHLEMRESRIIQHTSRYDQMGRLSGWVRVGRLLFESPRWWGIRDHSWGVRPDVGGFEATTAPRSVGALWQWLHAGVGDTLVHIQSREDGRGHLEWLEGFVRRGDVELRVVSFSHDLKFSERGREWVSLRHLLTLEDGSQVEVEADPILRPWAYRGTGYENGFADSRGVGVARGDLVEYDVLDISIPGRVTRDGEPYRPGHREQPARVLVDGDEGMGHAMVLAAGVVSRYGLGEGR